MSIPQDRDSPVDGITKSTDQGFDPLVRWPDSSAFPRPCSGQASPHAALTFASVEHPARRVAWRLYRLARAGAGCAGAGEPRAACRFAPSFGRSSGTVRSLRIQNAPQAEAHRCSRGRVTRLTRRHHILGRTPVPIMYDRQRSMSARYAEPAGATLLDKCAEPASPTSPAPRPEARSGTMPAPEPDLPSLAHFSGTTASGRIRKMVS